jgi:iron complex outermembrane receptor protein
MNVAQINANTWAVSARGFNGQYANKMLVLVDGVRLNDAQSGHHNGDIPVPLDAIERIEVLHGPGSSLFGADAFLGVINIKTRSGDSLNGGTSRGRVSTVVQAFKGLE